MRGVFKGQIVPSFRNPLCEMDLVIHDFPQWPDKTKPVKLSQVK